MGSLAAQLAEARNPMPGPRCSVAIITQGLDDVDRKALERTLASDLNSETISEVLQSAGLRVSGATLQRHRRGKCSCDAR